MSRTVGSFQSKVSAAAADPLGAIAKQLGDMGNLNVDALANLPGAEQLNAVKGFASSATNVGAAASNFLTQFGG